MDSKKKMIIAISAFAMVILAAIVAVVAVLAAQQVTIKSSINVTYTSSEVAAKVTAHYQVKGGEETAIGNTIEFDGTETGADATKDMNTSELKINSLTSENNYVDFIFTFTNEGQSEYTATLTLPATLENFDVTYSVPNTDGATKILDTSFTVAGNTTTPVEYIITFTIKDVAKNAKLAGNFSWSLN